MKLIYSADLHPDTVMNAVRLADEARQARRKKPQRRNPDKVIAQAKFNIPQDVLTVAMLLAKGDSGRIELCSDGSAVVHNSHERRWSCPKSSRSAS